MMRKQYTVKQFRADFPSDDACLDYLLAVRYGERPVCEGCSRETKYHRISGRRCYGCQWCGFQVYPTAGTVFEKTRTPLTDWFYAMYLMTATRNGVAAKELERQLGVTYKTAWRMAHQIRKLMAHLDDEKPQSRGHVEIDETYVGGKRKGKRGRGAAGKTIVMSMLERDGDIKTKVVADVKRKTLQPIIQENVEEGSTVSTDELASYNKLVDCGFIHGRVKHSTLEFVRGIHHVNGVEGFWSHFKNGVRSTHIHVSAKHLHKYLGEFQFRFNARHVPGWMFYRLLSHLLPRAPEAS